MSNYIHYKVSEEVPYPFPDFNGTTAKKLLPTFFKVCIYLSLLGFKVIRVS